MFCDESVTKLVNWLAFVPSGEMPITDELLIDGTPMFAKTDVSAFVKMKSAEKAVTGIAWPSEIVVCVVAVPFARHRCGAALLADNLLKTLGVGQTKGITLAPESVTKLPTYRRELSPVFSCAVPLYKTGAVVTHSMAGVPALL